MRGREPAAALVARAEALGVETSYRGADGVWRRPSARALDRIVAVLADDRPTFPPVGPPGPPAPAWPRMPGPNHRDRRVVLFCPTYALWSPDGGDPSIAHLHELCRAARRHGVDVVATLPLYAAFLDDPFDPSPYTPVSRRHWNEAYLDPEVIPGADRVPAPMRRPGPRVDWRALAATRRRQLLDAAARLDRATATAVDHWCRHERPDVAAYARFRARRDFGTSARPGVAAQSGLAARPGPSVRPGPATQSGLAARPGPKVRPGPEGDAELAPDQVIRSYELGQWLMERSLERVAGDPDAAGLGLDLPIGSHPAGFEVDANPDLFAPGMQVGAPPDPFFAVGQNWGFPPPLPGAGRRSGHRLWRELVERAGRFAAVLRIDHIMGVHRLWWIPEGHPADDGAYVRYPAREILTMIAEAARATRTEIVGENLGTVPPEVDEALTATGTLGMHEEQFTMTAGSPPGPINATVMAGIRTHDMVPFAVAAADPASTTYATALGVGPPVDPGLLLDRVLVRLGSSPAPLVAVDIDDLDGGTTPHNVPGVHDPDGWSRRAPRPVGDLLESPEVARRLRLVVEARGGQRL